MEKIKKEEEIKKGLKLLDIVASDNILANDPDKVIYEGALLKFSPGVKLNYQSKWAQITKREFRYYKDRLSATEWLARPLVSLPLHFIDKVERVSVKIGKGVALAKGEKEHSQFEIFLIPEKRIMEEIKVDKVERSKSASRKKEAKNGVKLATSPKVSIAKNDSANVSITQKAALAGVAAKDKNSYMEFIRNKGTELTKVSVQQQINGQGISSWIPALSGADTWTSREKIWKNIQARQLFAHQTKAECEKWVFVLNWVIDIVKDSA